MSLWTMGFNQHVRGVWANQMVYNLHLLTGKISEPGNSPFSLTGQPSACGTAREVGTFAHRLPADMVVTNPEHRKHAEEIWRLPQGLLPDKPGYHAVQQDRMLKDGKLNFYWVQVNNNVQAAPNSSNETYPGYRNPDNFIVVSDAYPTVTAHGGRPDPARRHVGGEGGRLRQRRAPHPCLAPARQRAGRSALRPLAAGRVLETLHHRRGLAGGDPRRQSGLPRQDPVRRAVPERQGRPLPARRARPGIRKPGGEGVRLLLQKGLFEEYADFGRGHGHDLAPYDAYHEVRGLRWPVVDGKETQWRYREGYDPYVKPGEGVKFYGRPDGKAVILAVPYEPPAESPDEEYDVWLVTGRVLEHWHSGSMTHARAGTLQGLSRARVCFMNADDARTRGINQGAEVRIVSRRGEIRVAGRDARPQPHAARRDLRALVRCQPAHQQGHARRHRSHLQADGFQEMRGQGRFGRLTRHGATGGSVRRGSCSPGRRRWRRWRRVAAADGDRSRRWRPCRPSRCRNGSSTTSARCAPIPDQPPVIPHSIEGYQLSVNTNRCLSCHKREFTEGSGAPMISVTHYMTRDGQMLADVSPRRYFCTACHVPQADVAAAGREHVQRHERAGRRATPGTNRGMARIKSALCWAWRMLTTPAATLSLAFLTLGGFVGGVLFWGAFNTALELTNTETVLHLLPRDGGERLSRS